MLEYADSCLKDNCQFGFKPYPSNNVNALNPCFLSLASVLIAILLSIIVLLQFIELFKIKKVPPNFKYKKNHVLKYFSTSYIIHISNVALYGILVVVQYALFINNEGQAEYTKIIPPITKLSLLSNIIFIVCFSIPSQLVQYFKTSAAISGNLFYFMFSACLNLFQFSQRWFHLSDKDMYNVLPGPIAGYLELGLFIVSTLCLVYLTAHYEPSKVLLDYYKEKGIYPPVNFFQSITFTWMNPLITDVYKKGKIEDPYNMPLPPCNLSARECTERLRARWEQELWDNKDNNDKKSSIVKAILKTFGGTIACAIVYEMLQDILSVIEPLVLRTFIKSFTQEYREQYPLLNSLFIVLTLFGIKIISTCLSNQFYITIFEAGLGIRSSLMCMVYQKGLKLSVDAREQKSSGDILNLASVDVLKIQRFFETSQGIFGTPIQLVGVLLSLYSLVGRAVFGGLVVMIIMAPINSYLSKKLEGLYRKNMEYKDTRTKLITEILNSIKSIKLYAWETPMLKKLFHVRNGLELENFKKVSVLDSFILFAWNMVPIMVSTSTFLLYAYLYNIPLTPDIVFPALSLFDLLGDCIYIIPNVITDIIETKVSIERLRDFLLLDEIDDSYVEVCDPSEDLPALEIQNCTFLWGSIKTNQSKKTQDNYDEEAETTALKVALKNIDNFKVVPGELTCIVGRVGAGKTTLLKAILGELPCTNGSNPSLPPKMIIRGTSIAFCPQQPWVMNSSVKDNIIFGHRYEEKFYKLTLKACQLLPDLEILPDGDQTMVGEKGISLSGGQKARLVLARAVYSRSDIYLLDDVLSAVDAEVSSNIIQQVLSRETGILKNKTIILATNAIKVLRHAQNIYALNNGEIVENGTYSEIMRADSRNSPLKKLIQEFASVEQDGPNISEQKQEAVEEQRKNEQELAFERANDNIVLDDNGVFQEINDLSVTKTAARSIDGGSIYSLDTRRPSMASFKRPTVLLDHEHDNRKTKQDVEKKEVGKVKKSVYLVYIKACGYVGVFFFFVFLVSSNLFNIVEKLWLKYWSEKNEKTHSNEHLIKYASIYMGICITDAAFSVLKSIVMMFFCSINASKYLHDTMAKSVLSSPMTFFETTPVGRIINRFTADIGSVDSGLHFIFSFLFRSILNYCFTVIVIGSVLPWFIVFNFVILLFYFYRRERVSSPV
ncbi:related to Bile pigment transporter 1 [Saccharomycodes ludwigii]|uniref:Related to Bile pigment transporter 1 n=1 Tax=Saccharomycodes ludwigii TaxID=36035 RepID=A0A376BC09_9ASCO|nr:related to Bile pigment transporter 1 [Saccharomycodes ludwigii]